MDVSTYSARINVNEGEQLHRTCSFIITIAMNKEKGKLGPKKAHLGKTRWE